MRGCKIEGCTTRSSDKNRCLFEVKGEDRLKWIPLIQTYQLLDDRKTLYVCDLHFNKNDLIKNGKTLRLKNGAMPQLGSIDPEQPNYAGDISSDHDPSTSFESNHPHDNISNTISISVEVYHRLIKDSIDLVKANEILEKLNRKIIERDAEIRKLKSANSNSKMDHLSAEQKEVLDTLINRCSSSRTRYSPETRSFCLRMQFHSTAAYNELRKFFGYRLPACGTLRRWLRSVDASPGITQPALDEITEKATEYREKEEKLYLCLMSDDISIRKQVEWNAVEKTFDGFPTVTNTNSKKNLPTTKEALVFMAVGRDFKMPVAYFFINGLQAIDRAILTREVITAVDNTGAKVISLTGDGLSANVAVAKMLGADFNSNKPYFPRPGCSNERIYMIFDPPHMIKLIRRYLAYHQLYYKDEKLNWELIKLLAEKQDKDNFDLGNKLLRKHINFKDAPMNVLLAVQTISNSVADAIEQLSEDGYEGFTQSASLVKFLRVNNNVFDIMNYGDGKPSDEHFKNPMCSANIQKIREAFEEFEDFTNHISVEEVKRPKNARETVTIRKVILKSRSSMGFFGLLNNIKSTLGIYADYVENGPLEIFFTFQYSQDHLETYFSLIRGSLGWNNNPNAIQFQSSYRKLLVCMPYSSARKGNCILNSTSVLTISSAQKSAHQTLNPFVNEVRDVEIDSDKYFELLNHEVEPYDEHLQALVASSIQENIMRQILKNSTSACQCCLRIFDENPKIHDSLIAKKNQTKSLPQPCLSTITIVKTANVVFELLKSHAHVEFHCMAKTIFKQLDIEQLYSSSSIDLHPNSSRSIDGFTHKEEFIYQVFSEYMHMKSRKIGKRITIEEQNGRVIRRKLTRNIIFAGQ